MQEHVPLAPLTTLGIGGEARFFVEARTEAEVSGALAFAEERGLPVFVLGGGSNILVSDEGFPGLVLRVSIGGIEGRRERVLTAGAGEGWDAFVARTVEQGLSGIECLSGIPGLVGGTPIQNVGAYGQDVGETVLSVRAWDRIERRPVELTNAECGFGYRSSIFNTTARNRFVILTVSFELKDEPARVTYPDLERALAGRAAPSLAEVRSAVLAIRKSKAMVIEPGDEDCRSVGSFFKNPIVSADLASHLDRAPRFPMPDGSVKVSAAWLVENAGFARGYHGGQGGRVGISSKHALAIINRGGASASEIASLAREIRDRVIDKFQVVLTPEPVCVGPDGFLI
jgi:UDP-N-acetylmuramate dehydrogenase